MPLQRLQQTQAAGTSTAAAATAGRDMQTVGRSAIQQHPQLQQHSTVYQQDVDRQMLSVCIYLGHLLASLCTVNFSLMQINV